MKMLSRWCYNNRNETCTASVPELSHQWCWRNKLTYNTNENIHQTYLHLYIRHPRRDKYLRARTAWYKNDIGRASWRCRIEWYIVIFFFKHKFSMLLYASEIWDWDEWTNKIYESSLLIAVIPVRWFANECYNRIKRGFMETGISLWWRFRAFSVPKEGRISFSISAEIIVREPDLYKLLFF